MSAEGFLQQPEAFSEPFNEFVLKTANGCNMQPQHELDRDPLALIQPGCDHCYMYTHSTAWQQEPEFMEPPVVERALQRIAEHAENHRLAHVRIIAHGGEPLLVLRKYPDYYAQLAQSVHKHIDPVGTKAHLFIQTNGLLLDNRNGPRIIEQLQKADFSVGLSIDGPQMVNDLHRRDRAGRSTHSRAERAAKLLNAAGAKWGVLGVIDPRTNPEEVVEYLASLDPQAINLFPLHAHNSAPPLEHHGAISLGEWQKRAFNRYNNWQLYHEDTSGPPFTMPIYDNYLQIAFGARSINDTAGERTTQEVFVTPSGKLERLDTLKTADDGAVFTGLNIFEHSFDDMRLDPGVVARRMGFAALAPLCQGCEVRTLCYGNHYPNRYKTPDEQLSPSSDVSAFVEAFRNPSAHCADHKIFLGYIDKLVRGIPEPITTIPTTDRNIIFNIPDDISELAGPTPTKPKSIMGSAIDHRYERMRATSLPNAGKLFQRCSSFQSFPFPVSQNEYYIESQEITPTYIAIQERELIGREALMAASMIAQTMHPGPVAYYAGDIEDRIPGPNEVVMLSKDYNDAIVNSLLIPSQPYMQGIEAWARQKREGYWFITRDIADRIAANYATAHGYVVPAQLPDESYGSTFIGPEYGVDYMASVALRSITQPVPVTVYDLPGDILVVDAPNDSPESHTAVVEEAALLLSAYKNPELLAQAFKKRGQGTITSLWNMWPSSFHAKMEWQSRDHLPIPATKPIINTEIAYIIDSNLKDNTIPHFQNGPLYQSILAMA